MSAVLASALVSAVLALAQALAPESVCTELLVLKPHQHSNILRIHMALPPLRR